MDYFNAFWTGGLICALVQILLDRIYIDPCIYWGIDQHISIYLCIQL